MLINVSTKNFKSFNNLQRLSMISSSKIQDHKDHIKEFKDIKLLKNAVIYGANASGKSNLVEIFRFMQWSLKHGLPLESKRFFSRTKKENQKKNSEFEIQFSIKDKIYAYGFSALLFDNQITGEWLYELRPHGENKLLFEYEHGKTPILGKTIKIPKQTKNRFTIYAEDFIEQDSNRLFLSIMNKGKDISKLTGLEFFSVVYNWLCNHIIVISPNTLLNDFEYYYQEDSLQHVNELLNEFDTGISEISIKKISQDELKQILPIQVYNQLIQDIKSTTPGERKKVTMRSKNTFFSIDLTNIDQPNITTLGIRHGDSPFDFSFSEESEGTQRIFDLLDMILSHRDDVVYIVDELERSLHPNLTKHFLEAFIKSYKNTTTQLIFTTHESSIMDLKLFRRDEIWFVDRDGANCSHIYSLSKFKERYDTKLSKAYLEGRYGAVPVLSPVIMLEEINHGTKRIQ